MSGRSYPCSSDTSHSAAASSRPPSRLPKATSDASSSIRCPASIRSGPPDSGIPIVQRGPGPVSNVARPGSCTGAIPKAMTGMIRRPMTNPQYAGATTSSGLRAPMAYPQGAGGAGVPRRPMGYPVGAAGQNLANRQIPVKHQPKYYNDPSLSRAQFNLGPGQRGPSAIPRTSAALSNKSVSNSLETSVRNDLMKSTAMNMGGSAHAKGSQAKLTAPPVIPTPHGNIRGTHQMTLTRTVNRQPQMEIVSKHLTTTSPDGRGRFKKIELNLQNVESGGLNASECGNVPLHEVISVSSTLTTASGVKSRVDKTIYEFSEPDDAQSRPEGINPYQILEMVEEESKDVDRMRNVVPPELKGSAAESYPLKKKLQKMKLNPESVRQLESSIVIPPRNADEPQEELQPELMAAIMHNEEKGLTMDSPPAKVYNYLFPDVLNDLVVEISAVSPGPLQNVVVPVTIPSELHVAGITPQLKNVAENTRMNDRAPPVDNMYSKTLKTGAVPKEKKPATKPGKQQSQPKQTERAKKPIKTKSNNMLLMDEDPPWNETAAPMTNRAGAVPSMVSIPEDPLTDEPAVFHNKLYNSLEYNLIPEGPRHISRVQLRGCQKPSWFPGYILALSDGIRTVRAPNEVLPAAWQAVQPDIFAEDSFMFVR